MLLQVADMVLTKQQVSDFESVIVSAFKKDYVISALSSTIEVILSEALTSLVDGINARVERMAGDMELLKTENLYLRGELKKITDTMEQNKRKQNLCVYNLPEIEGETVEKTFTNALKKNLNISLPPGAITSCRRVGKSVNSKPRPALIGFANSTQKIEILKNRTKFKGTRIMINEDLTKTRRELFKFAVQKYGREHVWTWDGEVSARVKGKRIRVDSVSDLEDDF